MAIECSYYETQHASRVGQDERKVRSLLHEQTLWKEVDLDLATLSKRVRFLSFPLSLLPPS